EGIDVFILSYFFLCMYYIGLASGAAGSCRPYANQTSASPYIKISASSKRRGQHDVTPRTDAANDKKTEPVIWSVFKLVSHLHRAGTGPEAMVSGVRVPKETSRDGIRAQYCISYGHMVMGVLCSTPIGWFPLPPP
ncbi:hypothetical protein BS47DRAFT_1335668, partial [Hydnum rufescens UP504]